MIALGDVNGMLCGALAMAESGLDGLASAAHTSTAPTMASPTAIEALTGRFGCQRDELRISFDRLLDSGRDRTSHNIAGAPLIAGAPGVRMIRSGSRLSNALVQQNGEATLLVEALTLAASVEAPDDGKHQLATVAVMRRTPGRMRPSAPTLETGAFLAAAKSTTAVIRAMSSPCSPRTGPSPNRPCHGGLGHARGDQGSLHAGAPLRFWSRRIRTLRRRRSRAGYDGEVFRRRRIAERCIRFVRVGHGWVAGVCVPR